jgi:hypothetical protein
MDFMLPFLHSFRDSTPRPLEVDGASVSVKTLNRAIDHNPAADQGALI